MSIAPLIAGLGGVVIGVVLGSELRFVTGEPGTGGLFPAGFMATLGAIGLLGALIVVGGVLLIPRATRNGGRLTLLLAVGVTAGILLGLLFGRTYQPSRQLAGEMTVAFDAPVATSMTSAATCETIANGDRIAAIRVERAGEVGVDDLGIVVRLEPPARVDLLLHRLSAYSGDAVRLDTSTDGRSGSLALGDMTASIEGTRNSLSGGAIVGQVTWRCEDALAPAASTTTAPLQGFITLSGVFTTAELRATGECDATRDLRVGTIETVAPWTGGSRARIDLMPGRDTATITVDLADGTAPESATSPAKVLEQRAAAGFITSRSMTATFDLSAGLVRVYAEWVCPDDIEAGNPKD